MAHIKRKYIDSHWSVYIVRGLISLLFGWLALFSQDYTKIISIIAVFLLCLAIVEFLNALHRARQKTGWAISISIAIIDVVIGLALLLTAKESPEWHLYMIAGYTFVRGFFEIITGFRTDEDDTDRFIWILCGMCGAIMGIVVLNGGVNFLSYFGAYLFALGVSSLIYGIHNRSQKKEDLAARKETAAIAARKRKKSSKVASRKK